jgi:DNA-binding XRE family transcriptional regulator
MLFEIGEQIREARKNRHVSQAEVARTLGMSRTTIGQIENGTVQEELRVRPAGKPPTLDELRKEDR